MRKALLLFIIVGLAVGGFFYYRSRKSQQQSADQSAGGQGGRGGQGAGRGGRGGRGGAGAQIVPVTIASAAKRDVSVYLDGLGSVTAFNTVTVKSRVDGEITKVDFTEGQDVKEGQLLAQIDPRPYQVALSQAEATLFRDQSQLTIAKRNFERFSELLNQGVVSRQDLDAQESTYGQLQGTVRADQAAIDNAKLNITYCRITAPIGGRVGLRLVDPGNMVHASDVNGLLVITQLHPIAVLFTIPEDNLPSVLKKSHNGTLPVEIFSRDNQTKLASGQLTTINNQIDQTTGTVKLKAVFDNKENLLWPNQFVNARMLVDVKKDSIVVPAAAVQRGTQGIYTFVVKKDNTVEVRSVTVGVSQGNMVAIEQGINPGERVVTDGQDKLQAGSRVQVNQAPSANPAAPSTQQAAGN